MAVGNVPFGVHQNMARKSDDAFTRPATRRWRQSWLGGVCNVLADDGEVAIVEFPNVRATVATRAEGITSARVGAKSSSEFHG